MTQTFDTSRVGGGTYELEQDANGNYKLKSVGFEQVNKLNLPDLKTDDSTIGKPILKPIVKPDVADPFNKLSEQNTGGGQDYSGVMLKTPEVKDVSVRDAGEMTNTTYNQMTDAEKEAIATGTSGMVFDGAGVAKRESIAEENYNKALSAAQAAKGASPSIYSDALNNLTNARKELDNVYSTSKTYKTPRTISDQNKYLGRTFTEKATGLQAVKSNFQKAKEKANQIIDGSLTIKLFKGIGKGLKTFEDALLGPQQVALNKSNKDALTSLGYKTRGELGSNVDSQRIAGNPATNVFAGMNRTSATGNVMAGARKRVSTIQRTIDRAKAKGDTAKAERFEARKKEFNKQIEEVQAKKNKADLATGGVAPGASGGGGGSGGCFLKGTLITMLDGTTKTVEQVDLGDKVAVGGKVFAVGRFLNTELYDYKGIKVSGSHMVNEDGVWVRVRDTKHGKSLGDDLNTVYVFGSENRRILINNILFTDYFEVSEQDQLINNEKNFFNNWKSYENTIDEHNVNTLNGS